MPLPTKSSTTPSKRSRKTSQAVESAAEERRICGIEGCTSRLRKQQEYSRHKWTHLPEHLQPTCPFENSFGERCTKKYLGRAFDIKRHWASVHWDAGPFPSDFEWPSLDRILRENNLTLGEEAPPAGHFPSTGPASSQVVEPDGTREDDLLQAMPYFTQWPVDSRYYPPGYNLNYSPDLVQQCLPSPHVPPYNTNLPATSHSALDDGGHPVVPGPPQAYLPTSSMNIDPAIGGQYAPPFNHELGNRDWDVSSTNSHEEDSTTSDQEWDPSVDDVFLAF